MEHCQNAQVGEKQKPTGNQEANQHDNCGRIFLDGGEVPLVWNPQVKLRESKMQVLPTRLRKYPGDYTDRDHWLATVTLLAAPTLKSAVFHR